MEQHLQRASLLYSQKRYPEAEREVRQYLSQYPDRVDGLYILAEVLSAQDQHTEALEINANAIALSPNDDEVMAQRALILYRLKREPEAIRQLEEAIQINPLAPVYFGLLGELRLTTKAYEAALQAANQGLSLDPDSTFCLNVRARALVKLEKGQDALDTIANSLEQQPGNSYTHANLGWSKLEIGRATEAQEHFREALRLDPNNNYAQGGMVEAIKARNIFYRLFLRYVFWMNRLSAKYQWAFIIGIYVGFRVVSNIAENNPDLAPFLQPLLYAYIAFALSTWFFEPISNLFLFLHPYGKFLLRKEEKQSAQLVGLTLLLALAAFGIHLSGTAAHDGYLLMGIASIVLMIPVSAMNSGQQEKDKRLLRGATIGLAVLWLWGTWQVMVGQPDTAENIYTFLFIGVFVFQWLAIAKSSSRY